MSSKSTFSNSTSESYALALYELSKENSDIVSVEESMRELGILLNKSYDFREMILSPAVTKEDKKNVIFAIANQNKFSAVLKKFLGFLAMKNRLFFLNKIIESFLNLVSGSKGELKAKLVSSKELSAEDQNKIQNELSKDLKTSISIDYRYDPSLIAGLTIQIGSTMIDTSVRTKLKKIEKKMIEG